MAVKNAIASDIILKKDGVVIGCAQSASLDMTREVLDATCAASGSWGAKVKGQKNFSGSVDALLRITSATDVATNFTFADAYDAFDDDEAENFEMELTIGSATNGGYALAGPVIISSLALSHSATDTQTWSFSFENAGPMVKTPLAA